MVDEWREMSDRVDDIREDIIEVAKGNAPRKTGALEDSIKASRRVVQGKSINIKVTATATNRGFDYATWTHEAHYKLGAISASKSGGHSRFGMSFTVGRDYIGKIEPALHSAYLRYIQEGLDEVVARNR
jgi:hypothetical protein